MGAAGVIFDFDGVIANTEELHLAAYNQVLRAARKAVGRVLQITPDRYFSRYIVYGNFDGFRQMLLDHGLNPSRALLEDLCRLKDKIMDGQLGGAMAALPGVTTLLQHLAARDVPCGICSGARRQEIDTLLGAFTLMQHFSAIVSIEDVTRGKPDPQGYCLAFDRLNARRNGHLDKSQCLAIEDTEGGAAAAHAANLRVLGVATTSRLECVRQWADFAFENLQQVSLTQFDQWLGLPTYPAAAPDQHGAK
ncbi:MAG: HAD family hydrolase [Phycisphaerae bacterium]